MRNVDFAASLEVRKLYPVLEDCAAGANGLIRVIDVSGEDYVYPADLFERVELPAAVERALRIASYDAIPGHFQLIPRCGNEAEPGPWRCLALLVRSSQLGSFQERFRTALSAKQEVTFAPTTQPNKSPAGIGGVPAGV